MFKRACFALCLVLGLMPFSAQAGDASDYGLASRDVIPRSKYEFNLVGIEQGTLRGVFHFIWKGTEPLKLGIFHKPGAGTSVVIDNPRYYFLVGSGSWITSPALPCGNGLQIQQLQPNQEYLLLIDLNRLDLRMNEDQISSSKRLTMMIGAESGSDISGYLISNEIPLPLSAAPAVSH